jgi:hypothetical protein
MGDLRNGLRKGHSAAGKLWLGTGRGDRAGLPAVTLGAAEGPAKERIGEQVGQVDGGHSFAGGRNTGVRHGIAPNFENSCDCVQLNA